MSKIEIALPAMGEGIIEATITKWLVAVGDEVSEDQSLVEIATDKVDSEIPSPVAGKVSEILFKEGDVPQVGQIIAIIEDKSKGSTAGDNLKSTPVQHETQETEPINAPAAIIESTEKPLSGMLHKTSPLVRKIAKQEGLSEQELQQVKGTGLNERITRNDILDYISKRHIQTDIKIPSVSAESNQPASSAVEVIPMDRMRKLIA
ncbi:MAG: biotin/lipoyl-containing protein, partial [Tenuifilaceae bacterium]|nr:biotin/lipoyl-containing protein [Tenuifilaceae bacterium]